MHAALLLLVRSPGPTPHPSPPPPQLLTGELEAESGLVWKHPNLRVAYVAQHAFHHIENHLDMTPNQYIQWRYATGEDRESLDKVSRKVRSGAGAGSGAGGGEQGWRCRAWSGAQQRTRACNRLACAVLLPVGTCATMHPCPLSLTHPCPPPRPSLPRPAAQGGGGEEDG